jgi:hypothetical protein
LASIVLNRTSRLSNSSQNLVGGWIAWRLEVDWLAGAAEFDKIGKTLARGPGLEFAHLGGFPSARNSSNIKYARSEGFPGVEGSAKHNIMQ